MTNSRRATCVVATIAAALTAGAPAGAQEQAASTSETTSNEDIVVTATRRAERIQDIPIAVSALTQNELNGSGVVEIRDLLQVVPGLNFVQSQQSAQPVIRGITSTNPGIGDEANVSIYVDGIYQPDALANNFDLLQIERVEVLRGPRERSLAATRRAG